jgi:hypothetical protein
MGWMDLAQDKDKWTRQLTLEFHNMLGNVWAVVGSQEGLSPMDLVA